MTKEKQKKQKAWIITVDMGYGHQRAAYPLTFLSQGETINANNYSGIPLDDRKIWHNSKNFYEFISRFKQVPLIGESIFAFYDRLQSIPSFYPRRDLSAPTLQVKQVSRLIRESHWGKHLIKKLSAEPVPIVTTFFVPAFMAEYFKYPGDIYCLVTDSDMSRAWVPEHPHRSRIRYFAPTYRVADRLKLYGIREENIFLTGFPLPIENLGGRNLEVLKSDMAQRLSNLDPKRRYCRLHAPTIHEYVGSKHIPKRSSHPLTLMFAVGGAGAQRDIAVEVLASLRERILRHQIRYVMVAGINNEVAGYFKSAAQDNGLRNEIGKHIEIIHAREKVEYFKAFNHALRTTDILWSKPSELSFYTALGVPLIMAPPIGSQEFFNQHWVEAVGSGANQEDPLYTSEWLFDWLDSGWLAESAMEGFIEAPKFGTYNIEAIVNRGEKSQSEIQAVLQF